MKAILTILFALSCCFVFSQEAILQQKLADLKSCRTRECQLSQAISISECHVEADRMEKAQEWITYSKKLHRVNPKDSISYFINSLQSEIFYYMELYQFGLHEAEKGIERAKIIKDSAYLSDAYFFKGINQVEMNLIVEAQQSLQYSEKAYPKKVRKHLRTIIGKAYIYNNIAQVKLRVGQLDSAVFYNKKAFALGMEHRNFRGIVNSEQTFALIYAEKKMQDSARHYMKKSLASAEKYGLYDVAAMNCAYLMRFYLGDDFKVRQYYQQGLGLIASNEVNNAYKRYFYTLALGVFEKLGDPQQTLSLQRKIIKVNDLTNNKANHYLENIMEQYMKSENALLTVKINELNQQKDITILQLVATLLFVLILLFVIIIFRRKNKLQRLLLDQKNEISEDLHDDIGSELSSILINTNLLMGNFDTNEKQQFLLSKIGHTSAEISQRLNAFIWSLNNENNSVGNFCEYVQQYASKLFDGSEVVLDYSANTGTVQHKILNGYFRKNLFFSIKEALNNAIKHASATNVKLSISANEKELQIAIVDNGVGIQRENTFGNGFKNIKKRIASLKGFVHFKSADGLTIIIAVPLPNH